MEHPDNQHDDFGAFHQRGKETEETERKARPHPRGRSAVVRDRVQVLPAERKQQAPGYAPQHTGEIGEGVRCKPD